MINETINEPITIGLGEINHEWLKRFKEEGLFSEMRDAYKFAIAYALSKGVAPPEILIKKETVFNIGSLDFDRELYFCITSLMPEYKGSVYEMAERLADAGMTELVRDYQDGKLNVVGLIENQIES